MHARRHCAILVGCISFVLLQQDVRAGTDVLAALERQQQALFERVAPSVVLLSRKRGFGSGFFVSSDGLILTNAHVVAGARKVTVVCNDGRKVQGRVVERAPNKLDLALVKVDIKSAPALPLGNVSRLRLGSWVASIGHNQGGIWTFNTGMVTNIYPVKGERPIFQTQIPLNPGSSGGPIFDRRGRAVGIVTAGIKGSNSINFGIRIDVAVRRLKRLKPTSDRQLVIRAPAGVAIFVDGQMVGSGPEVVIGVQKRKVRVQAVIRGRMTKRLVDASRQKTVQLR